MKENNCPQRAKCDYATVDRIFGSEYIQPLCNVTEKHSSCYKYQILELVDKHKGVDSIHRKQLKKRLEEIIKESFKDDEK